MQKHKLSSFIFFHFDNNNVILYSTLNRVRITIRTLDYELIMVNKDIIDNLLEIKRPLFTMLKKLKYIIMYDCDEFKEIETRYNIAIFNNTSYRLTVLPTLDCNFKCWYCYEKRKDKKLMSEVIVNRVKKHVQHKIEQELIKHLVLDWFGGEPLLGFEKIIYPLSIYLKNLAQKNGVLFSNTITTNGYLIKEEWLPFFDEIQLNSFQITLDGNEVAHNKIKQNTDAYRKTINNINRLCESLKKVTVTLRFNYTDDKLESIKDIVNDIPESNRGKIIISLQKVWQEKVNVAEHDVRLREIYSYFRLSGFKINEYHPQNVQACYADRFQQAVINYDGLVFKCTARDFTQANSDGKLDSSGDITWETNKFFRRMAVKRFHYATCENCNLLPLCFGPCSQKVLETSEDKFQRICNYEGLKSTLIEYLERENKY